MGRVALLAISIALLTGCGPQLTLTQSAGPLPPVGNSLRYFGFAGVECLWDDPLDEMDKTSYADEVAGFSNIGQLCVYDPAEDISPRLESLRAHGLRAMLHVEPVLFGHAEDPESPSGDRAFLLPDAPERWARFMQANGPLLTPDTVAAVFVIDEPAWHGLSLNDLEAALALIKADLPNLPTATVEAYGTTRQTMAPPALDWVGFDRYGTADPATDAAWQADLAAVRAALTRPEQRILLVVETFWLPMYGRAGVQPEQIGILAENYYRFAAAQPDVIGLIGYLWPGGLDGKEQLGARNLPENVRETYRAIGEKILHP